MTKNDDIDKKSMGIVIKFKKLEKARNVENDCFCKIDRKYKNYKSDKNDKK